MTDQPGRPPEERQPAPRPSSVPVPADRFSAPPSARRRDLTPERAARIVRASANARLVGFLAVTLVGLFVIGYYFYEVGLPGGLSQSRLTAQASAQLVTSIQRGYNVFEGNCAQCHGPNGEGGKGPQLNRQDKLFAHLNPAYIATMLQVGGRYACGNANSIMPVWSNTGSPPGPLNYKQMQDVINFIRAPLGTSYVVLDPNLFEPVIDPVTGKEKTFTGWVDPNYAPAPGATPFPACWTAQYTASSASAAPGVSPAASGAPGPSGSPAASGSPAGTVLQESALNIAFEVPALSAPAGAPFQIVFNNKDAGTLHNIVIRDATGTPVFTGDLVTGPATITYNVPPLPAGAYTFNCAVHPVMTGTLTVGG